MNPTRRSFLKRVVMATLAMRFFLVSICSTTARNRSGVSGAESSSAFDGVSRKCLNDGSAANFRLSIRNRQLGSAVLVSVKNINAPAALDDSAANRMLAEYRGVRSDPRSPVSLCASQSGSSSAAGHLHDRPRLAGNLSAVPGSSRYEQRSANLHGHLQRAGSAGFEEVSSNRRPLQAHSRIVKRPIRNAFLRPKVRLAPGRDSSPPGQDG